MKILTILICLVVMFMGCWLFDLGGNAMTIFGFGFVFTGSLVLVDELASLGAQK